MFDTMEFRFWEDFFGADCEARFLCLLSGFCHCAANMLFGAVLHGCCCYFGAGTTYCVAKALCVPCPSAMKHCAVIVTNVSKLVLFRRVLLCLRGKVGWQLMSIGFPRSMFGRALVAMSCGHFTGWLTTSIGS
jgi:hypothetical protein